MMCVCVHRKRNKQTEREKARGSIGSSLDEFPQLKPVESTFSTSARQKRAAAVTRTELSVVLQSFLP